MWIIYFNCNKTGNFCVNSVNDAYVASLCRFIVYIRSCWFLNFLVKFNLAKLVRDKMVISRLIWSFTQRKLFHGNKVTFGKIYSLSKKKKKNLYQKLIQHIHLMSYCQLVHSVLIVTLAEFICRSNIFSEYYLFIAKTLNIHVIFSCSIRNIYRRQ